MNVEIDTCPLTGPKGGAITLSMARRAHHTATVSATVRARFDHLILTAVQAGNSDRRAIERVALAAMTADDRAALDRSGTWWTWATTSLTRLRAAGQVQHSGRAYTATAPKRLTLETFSSFAVVTHGDTRTRVDGPDFARRARDLALSLR